MGHLPRPTTIMASPFDDRASDEQMAPSRPLVTFQPPTEVVGLRGVVRLAPAPRTGLCIAGRVRRPLRQRTGMAIAAPLGVVREPDAEYLAGTHVRFRSDGPPCVARHGAGPVSYTHLTLPTNREVEL